MIDVTDPELWPWPRDETLTFDAVRSALAAFAYGTATEAQVARTLNEGAVSRDPVVRDYVRRTDVPVPWPDTASYNAYEHLATAEASVDPKTLRGGIDAKKRQVQREHGWFARDARHIAELLARAPWIARDLWPNYEKTATCFAHTVRTTSAKKMNALPCLSRSKVRTTRGWEFSTYMGSLPTDVIAVGPLRGWYCCGWLDDSETEHYPRISVHGRYETVGWSPYARTVMMHGLSHAYGGKVFRGTHDVFSDVGLDVLCSLISAARTSWTPRRHK